MEWLILLIIVGGYLRIALAAFRSAARRLKADFPTVPITNEDLIGCAWMGLIWPIGWPMVCLISPRARRDGREPLVASWLRRKARAE